jgi:hypothetical protein
MAACLPFNALNTRLVTDVQPFLCCLPRPAPTCLYLASGPMGASAASAPLGPATAAGAAAAATAAAPPAAAPAPEVPAAEAPAAEAAQAPPAPDGPAGGPAWPRDPLPPAAAAAAPASGSATAASSEQTLSSSHTTPHFPAIQLRAGWSARVACQRLSRNVHRLTAPRDAGERSRHSSSLGGP